MNKKKVFFILSSLRAGGAERVYWLISQYFDAAKFDVSLVILNSNDPFFPLKVAGLKVIELKTVKASKSFFKLHKLIQTEKPDAVFTTGGQINILVAFISLFVKIPVFIARETNLIETQIQFGGARQRFWNNFMNLAYKRINLSICQSPEIMKSLTQSQGLSPNKLVIIPNPVIQTNIIKKNVLGTIKKLIVVARLTEQKGHDRLLDIFKELPEDYHLSIAGGGILKDIINDKIISLGLQHRIRLLGQVSNIVEVIAEHDLMVLPSFTEGFPNVVIEALSVGVPVVSFEVSGIASIIKNDFNGYVIPQNDVVKYKEAILKCFNKSWDNQLLKEDVNARFGIAAVVKQYEALVA